MKISYNWLKDYLDIDLAPEKVAEILTSTGLEVEGMEQVQSIEGGLQGLVIGAVESAEKHPNADKLTLTKVNVGGEELLQIVCGAPNVAAGQKVVVATVGTTLYPTEGDPFKIKKGKMRGEVSMGMICAEDEIGIGTDHDGIIVLDENAPVGEPVTAVIPVETDTIFEIGLTPNRSDATGHIGVAKDLLAALRTNENYTGNVKMPNVDNFAVDNKDWAIPVEVENVEACPRYTGVSISGVTIKESPDWLQQKLKSIGLVPISNVVDITNFILHELGQPLHAFDADEIVGKKVIVKNLTDQSTFVTLDEKERKLSQEDLMICDGEGKGMCIGGVFGGIKSGVKDTTKNIFLESACFNPVSIRKTSKRHDLRTDAATRFEKGVDPNGAVYALKRAAMMIKELAGGQIASDIVDIYPNKVESEPIKVRFARVNLLAGIEISSDRIIEILNNLEMDIVETTDEHIVVKVPTNKVDVLREIDVIEEIFRIYSYNKIEFSEQLNSTLAHLQPVDRKFEIKNLISNYLVGKDFLEMMNNSISKSVYYDEKETDVVKILNSLTTELDVLRKNMLFSGLEVIAYNQNRKNNDLKLFEFGTTYWIDEQQNYQEQENLSLFLTGIDRQENWWQEHADNSFFDLKQSVHNALQKMGIQRYQVKELDSPHFAYGLEYGMGDRSLVQFGLVHPSLVHKMDVKGEVWHALFNWNNILKCLKPKQFNYEALPKFPSVKRDMALIVDQSVRFGDIERLAQKNAKKLLQSINLFDVYEDPKLGENKKSYAVSFTFLDENKTLTKKEIDKTMNRLLKAFEKELGATLK